MRFVPIFISSVFLSLHFGAILYVNSSLLGGFFEPDVVSLLFLAGALGNIFIFLFAPRLIEKLGKRPLLIFFLAVTAITTYGLALATGRLSVALFFVIYASFFSMSFYCLDIFLEELSKDSWTGEIRGVYLTFYNLGIASGPLILAWLSPADALKPVYLAATLLLIPPILLAIFFFRSRRPGWHGLHRRALLPFGAWWRAKSVRRVTIARGALEFFFTFMTIYTPLYLHGVLGFEWRVIGVMFAIMLLPFVLFQWPVGELADRFVGEKEFMITGFLIMGATLVFMPYLGATAAVWTTVLFLSRVGASLVEITTESFFFKHVDADDTGFLSIFRLTRPASIVLGAAVGALALNLFSFEKIFFVLAVVVFFGLKESLLIRDTR